MSRIISEAAKAMAREATKNVLAKTTGKKLATTGSYVKKLKNDNFVEINPDKQDIIGRPTLS